MAELIEAGKDVKAPELVARAALAIAVLRRWDHRLDIAAISNNLLLPLAAALPTPDQVHRQLGLLLTANGSWQLAASILAACVGAAKSSRLDSVEVLPVPQRITLAAELVQEAVQAVDGRGEATLEAAEPLLAAAAGAGFDAALELLRSADQTAAVRRAAGQLLLPAVMQVVERRGSLALCLRCLWATCKNLMGDEAAAERRVGLALLVQFCTVLLEEASIDEEGSWGSKGSAAEQHQQRGIRADPDFWMLLQRALLEPDTLSRKRAAHVLRAAVAAPGGAPPAQPWRSFLQLWDSLDEFSYHLIR